MSRNTTEYCSLIEATSQLTRAVKNDLVQLSVELVANRLITVDKGEELRNRNVDVMDRAAELVALVTNKVEQDKENYYTFVRILMCYRITYGKVLEVLEPVYSTGGHIYNKGACVAPTITQPWFHGKLSRNDAERRLREMEGNAFLFRESTTQFGRLILSVVNGGLFYHFFIDRGVGTYEVEGTNLPFSSLVDLMDFYKKDGITEGNNGEIVILKLPCNVTIPRDSATGVSDSVNKAFVLGQKSKTVTSSEDDSCDYELLPGRTSFKNQQALLHQQKYFHGAISRKKAEVLLKKDGQYLVRESTSIPGQYVLTGKADGYPHHFLLTDGEGKVIFKDETVGEVVEFDSIPKMVTYFSQTKYPMIDDSSHLTLNEPINCCRNLLESLCCCPDVVSDAI